MLATGYVDTIDEIAAALHHDHVLVQQVIGSGDAKGAHDRISRLVSRLPFPTYVALVGRPTDLPNTDDESTYLTQALHKRLHNAPGLYIVESAGSPLEVTAFGLTRDTTTLKLQYYTNLKAVEHALGTHADGTDVAVVPTIEAEIALRTADVPPQKDYQRPNLSDAVVRDLVDRDRPLDPIQDEGQEPLGTGARYMIGSSVGFGVILLVQQTLRGWPGWRRKRTAAPAQMRPSAVAPPDPENVRRRAERLLTQLAEELADAAPRDAAARERIDRATLAREVAEPLLRSEDLADLAGAVALARTGLGELAVVSGRWKAAYRGCFFDPLHDAASDTVSWRLGEADVSVPVCSTCRAALRRGRQPAALLVGRRRHLQPYYERDDVWARTGFGSLVDDFPGEVLAARGSS